MTDEELNEIRRVDAALTTEDLRRCDSKLPTDRRRLLAYVDELREENEKLQAERDEARALSKLGRTELDYENYGLEEVFTRWDASEFQITESALPRTNPDDEKIVDALVAKRSASLATHPLRRDDWDDCGKPHAAKRDGGECE